MSLDLPSELQAQKFSSLGFQTNLELYQIIRVSYSAPFQYRQITELKKGEYNPTKINSSMAGCLKSNREAHNEAKVFITTWAN